MATVTSYTGQQLAKYLAGINPSIDVTDPIIQDGIINFGASVIDDVTARVASLSTKYTSTYLNQLSDSELDFYAYNALGLTRATGTPVTGYVYLMFNSLPSTSQTISIGSIFATSDNQWQFYSTQVFTIDPSNLNYLYNPVRSMYEVRIPVQAVSVGTSYRVAAYRVSTVSASLGFSARVENREPFVNGSDPETSTEFIARIQRENAGFNSNSMDGFYNMIMSSVDGLQDIVMQHSAGKRNQYEIYYIGYAPVADTVTFNVANVSQPTYDFPAYKTPIRYVDSVAINNVAVDSSLYTYSSKKLYLSSTLLGSLTSSDTIQASFQYNSLNLAIYSFLENNFDFPGADWSLNEGSPDYVNIKIRVKPQSFMTLEETQSLVSSTLIQYVNTNRFASGLQSEELRQLVLNSVPAVLDCRISINESVYYGCDFGHYPVLLIDNLLIDILPS